MGRDARHKHVIWVGRKPEYFCARDWTGRIALIRFNKFRCARRRRRADKRSVIRHSAAIVIVLLVFGRVLWQPDSPDIEPLAKAEQKTQQFLIKLVSVVK
jgi:hypothetical protein